MSLLQVVLVLVGISTQSALPATYEELAEKYGELSSSLKSLVRQNMLQYLYIEERVRSEGDSGVKQVIVIYFEVKLIPLDFIMEWIMWCINYIQNHKIFGKQKFKTN